MTFAEIKSRAQGHTLALCEKLLPGGKKRANQWIAGSVNGEAGESLNVELEGPKAGIWHDFATGVGGDLIDLVCETTGASKAEAAKFLTRFCGIVDTSPSHLFDPLKKGFRREEGEPWAYGSKAWAYRGADGKVFCWVVRFDKPDGKKDTLPLRFMPKEGETPDPTNPKHWRWKGFAKPEKPPIYNVNALTEKPDAPVMVVEGEKTADAAAKLFPDHAVVSWMGGCKKVESVDWTPLKGRHLVLWPDADKPGLTAMRFLKMLHPEAEVVLPHPSLPEGWDLADPIPAGLTLEQLRAHVDVPAITPKMEPASSSSEGEGDDGLDIHYDQTSSKWWVQRTVSKPGQLPGYVSIASETAKKIFIAAGFANFKDHDGITDVDREMIRRIRTSDMFYAGPLAGRRAGIYQSPLGDCLVTTDRPIFRGKPGGEESSKRLRTWLFELVAKDETQYWRLIYWLHLRRKAVRSSTWRHGHLLVLVGSANCGKSYLQSHIITRLLGGRIAKPYRYMSGGTDFNGDLLGAEHLMIEDEAPGRDMHSRRALGSHVKSMLFAEYQSAHPKNRQAITLAPIWAMTMSVNNEEENLMTLPPMDNSMKDKIILLRCEKPHVEPREKRTQWDELAHIVETELEPFAAYLDELEIPENLQEPRCGLLAYQNPDIMGALNGMTPETSLLALVDEVLLADPSPIDPAWEGTARELERALRAQRAQEMDRICKFDSAAGVLLKRLQDLHPHRISRRIRRGTTLWRIAVAQTPE